jgi:hypothetical protein
VAQAVARTGGELTDAELAHVAGGDKDTIVGDIDLNPD